MATSFVLDFITGTQRRNVWKKAEKRAGKNKLSVKPINQILRDRTKQEIQESPLIRQLQSKFTKYPRSRRRKISSLAVIMLRGHVSSVDLIRGFFNPHLRRNLSAASIRYADEKDRKRAEGVFSWLKEIFKSDHKIHEALNAIDREGTVTVLDYSKVNRTCLSDFGRDILAEQNSNSVKKLPASSTMSSDLVLKFGFSDSYLPLLRRKLLTLPERIGVPIRTITGCNPRNTKPPIREPNMPEKQEKKDDKKDKKKKKPVIRTDSESYQNNHTLEAKGNLHDNMDVNFRHQWGIRIPEVEKNDFQVGQTWGQMQQLESPTVVAEMTYSSLQTPSAYGVADIQAMKHLQLTMSATKDSESKTEATGETSTKEIAQKSEPEPQVAKQAEEVESIESLKRILKTSVGTSEVSVFDEEYNIPPGTDYDAEIAAWKDLVLKSKVPLHPAKEEFEAEESNSRRVEMLSIRPEAPLPKLDVQAVPSNQEPLREEEDEPEVSNDLKATTKPIDVTRTGSPSEVQKMDQKKIHTGSSYSLYFGSDDKDTKMMASEYSTSSDSGWGRLKETFAKAAEGAKTGRLAEAIKPKTAESAMANIGIRRTDATEPTAIADQQQQSALPTQKLSNLVPSQSEEEDFGDSLNAVAEREIEISLSRSHQEAQQSPEGSASVSAHSNQRQEDVEEKRTIQTDDFHNSFDYANSYDDDYYPGYDSMSLEPVTEKSAIVKKKTASPQNEPATEELQYEAAKEGAVAAEGASPQKVHQTYATVDGDYIRLQGDPYPYSRQHFEKWRMSREDIHIGYIPSRKVHTLASPVSDVNFDMQPPARKMSHYANAYVRAIRQGKGVRD